MKRLSCYIRIGDLSFDFVSEVEVESAWDKLTDRAKITIPRNVSLKDGGVLPQISVGSEVEIDLGYDGNLRREFTGYVARIGAGLPIEIECEDEMWILKQSQVSQTWRKVNLYQMLNAIIPNHPVNVQNMDLGAFRISKVSTAKVLQSLQKQYGLRSFFRGGVLYVGLLHPSVPTTWPYSFQGNRHQDSLEYRSASDSKIKVKAISLLPGGGKYEVDLGDSDGEQRTLHYYDLDEKALKETAKAEISKLRRDGYKGIFITCGENTVLHGDILSLTDSDYVDREGSYQVEAVTTRFGQGGYVKEIKLGAKV